LEIFLNEHFLDPGVDFDALVGVRISREFLIFTRGSKADTAAYPHKRHFSALRQH
jgi:hypothetical protein